MSTASHSSERCNNLSQIVEWERSSYYYTNERLNEDNSTYNVQPDQKPKPTERLSTEHVNFLFLFHQKLPRELRDLVYDYIILYLNTTERPTWMYPRQLASLSSIKNSVYIIQHPGHIFRYDRHFSIRPFHLLPHHLASHVSIQDSQIVRHPRFAYGSGKGRADGVDICSTVAFELLTLFFTTHTFHVRYRYNPHLLTLLSTSWLLPAFIPGQHIRKLQIGLHTPESAEDDSYDFEDSEYEWKHLFPTPVNVKCQTYRRQLIEVVTRVGGVLNKQCALEFVVVVDEWAPIEEMEDWLREVVRELQGNLGQVRVRFVKFGWESMEMVVG